MGVESVIQQKFGKYKKLKGRNGTDYAVTCPFCHKKGKMYITPSVNVFHCFRCDESGPADSLIGHNFTAARNPVDSRIRTLPSKIIPPGDLISLEELPHDHQAVNYIRSRKFDIAELSNVYGVKYCNNGRTFAGIFNTTGALIFPFWVKGELIGWQARLTYNPDSLTDSDCEMVGLTRDVDGDWVKPPKYWTSPGLEKGRILYNYDWANRSEVVVISEGVFDAIGIGKSGVAALGKGVTDQQVGLIIDNMRWKLAVIMLDPGDATKEMEMLEASLRHTVKTLRVELQGYKDPGEAPREEIWLQIGRAAKRVGIDLFSYKFLL